MVSKIFFHNTRALLAYSSGDLPSVEDIAREVFVEEWRREHRFPDHYLKNRRNLVLQLDAGGKTTGKTLSQFILHVLDDLGSRYLEWRGEYVAVQEDRFGEWQDLLPLISPLLVMARKIQKEAGPLPIRPGKERDDYVQIWIMPNFHASALPHPTNPLLENLIHREGLIESHCHMNGSTEADIVWLDAVSQPDEYYMELKKGWDYIDWRADHIQELYQQIEPELTPQRVQRRLIAAREMRRAISEHLFDKKQLELSYVGRLSESNLCLEPRHWLTPQHPAQEFLWGKEHNGELPLEAAYLIACLSVIETTGDDALAHAFFFCQLVAAQINKLTVQQVEQRGFDQFQKITVSEARSLSEKQFQRRFQQLDVSESGDISFFEGRFAPGKSRIETLERMRRIYEGYKGFTTAFKARTATETRMEFGLVCHFIKRPEDRDADGNFYGCRHHKLRTSLNEEGRALVSASEFTPPDLPKLLLGIDAASSELHTPPEVFAPLFRYLRLHGARNFTYHVGEDFVHLLSGIRAINEPGNCRELRAGDRIGHGVAIGIDPELWLSRVGDHIVMKKGDYLDDLVFAYHHLLVQGDFIGVAMQLGSEVEKYSREIYGVAYSPQILHRAWEFRSIDPFFLIDPKKIDDLLNERQHKKEKELLERLDEDADAKEAFVSYHGLSGVPRHDVRRKWEELCEVKSAIVPPDAIRSLQEMQIAELITKKIAIESLPTSNMRIGFYHDFSEHHLFRWLGLSPGSSKQIGKQPVVVIGSDDPGIFATSIRAEYFHIYRVLTTKYDRTPNEALEILLRLHRNADAFRFSIESNLRVRS